MPDSDNLSLWRAVEKTDPAHTKNFSRGGGFKGTAISPMYLIQRATKQWGPMGHRWGVRIIEEKVEKGAPLVTEQGAVVGNESIHTVQIELFYPAADGEQGKVPAFGQTQLVGRNKYGFYTDEEAPKKSLTDALTKALSWLGFAADVHMGLFDDVKYVNQLNEEFRGAETNEKIRKEALAILEPAAKKGMEDLELAWKSISQDMRKACKNDIAGLKQVAAEKQVAHAH